MRGTAVLKSIEALYKEAEMVINDGVPMVAIVKSAPPVTKPDIPVAKRASAAPDNTLAASTAPDKIQPDSPLSDTAMDSPPSDSPALDTAMDSPLSDTAMDSPLSDQAKPDSVADSAADPAIVFDRIETLSTMAKNLDDDKLAADSTQSDSAADPAADPAIVFDRIETLSTMAKNLDDDKPAADSTTDHATDSAAPADPASPLPSAPPVPDYAGGIQQISDADLENVVKKAVDDIVAVAPLDSIVAGNERIESVMADIAKAVDNAETNDPAAPAATSDHTTDAEPADSAIVFDRIETLSTMAKNLDDDKIAADSADSAADPAQSDSAQIAADSADSADSAQSESADHGADATPADPAAPSATPAQPVASAKTAAAIDLDDLNDIVANTVKSVIREELSNLVQVTVKSALDELRATHDDKAKSTPSDR